MVFSHPTPGSLRRLSLSLSSPFSLYPRIRAHSRAHARTRTHASAAVFGPPGDGYRELYTPTNSLATTRIRYTVAYLHNIDVSNRPAAARGPSADALATLKFHRQPRVRVHELYKDNRHLLRSSRPLCSLRPAKPLGVRR